MFQVRIGVAVSSSSGAATRTLAARPGRRVIIDDGRNSISDYFEREVGEVLTVANSHLFILGPGRRFDLVQRQVIFEGVAAGRD